jgi:hypothetical protein
MKPVVLGVLGIGLFLLLLSSMWASLFSTASKWTDEKAKRSADVKARMAYLGGIVNSPNGNRSAADREKAKTEFDALAAENQQLNDEFTSAAETPQTVSRIMKWAGVCLAAVGIIGWYAVSQSG